jgi:hypothetical protein
LTKIGSGFQPLNIQTKQFLRRFSMKNALVVPVVAAVLLAIGVNAAEACYCGAFRCRVKCCPAVTVGCQMQTCTVMKTCKEVVYEERECTQYKTVFEEVIDKRMVDAVKYVEDTEYRCVPCTICQERQSAPCEPVKTCAPAACGESTCCEKVAILRKAPVTVLRPVTYQKVVETPRVVTKQVPYTIIICEPKVVYKQVPVTICCPVPCCCKPKCAAPPAAPQTAPSGCAECEREGLD